MTDKPLTIDASLDDLQDYFAEEELHPALKPYVQDEESWPTLKHPLVYQVPYSPQLNKQSNKMFETKKEVIRQAREEGRWETVVWMHERPYRLQAFLDVAFEIEDDTRFWELVGGIWTDSENCWQCRSDWYEIFTCGRDDRQAMMDDKEREALSKLPDEITVYRGFTKHDGEVLEDNDVQLHSFSWTLDRKRAVWFAQRLARDGDTSYVATAVVNKSDVVAHFLGRGEAEIVVIPDDLRITEVREP
jgi:hypothetical protein